MGEAGRRNWLVEEDAKLKEIVQQYGDELTWEEISIRLGMGRSGNSCRQRYTDHLHPDAARENFTDEEKCRIIQLHFEHGNRWARIARIMAEERRDGLRRTDNQIKNFWNGPITKEAKQLRFDVNGEEFRNTIMSTTPDQYPRYYFDENFDPYHPTTPYSFDQEETPLFYNYLDDQKLD